MATELMVPRSESALRRAFRDMISLKNRIKNIREESEELTGRIIRSGEVQTAAAIFGAIQGAWYDPRSPKDKPGAHLGPIPIEVAFGGATMVASLLGFGGRYAEHLHNFADGALAAYVSNVARGWGYKWQKEKATKSSTTGASLREELEALVNA